MGSPGCVHFHKLYLNPSLLFESFESTIWILLSVSGSPAAVLRLIFLISFNIILVLVNLDSWCFLCLVSYTKEGKKNDLRRGIHKSLFRKLPKSRKIQLRKLYLPNNIFCKLGISLGTTPQNTSYFAIPGKLKRRLSCPNSLITK